MIFLGLGSNMGNKVGNILKALELLKERGVQTLRYSDMYLTAPWGVEEQDEFVNAVAEISFLGSPMELLEHCLAVEIEMGRVRKQKWGPRLIDIDLLEFNRLNLQTERLLLPHPWYPQREFVLLPFAQLEPEWIPTGGSQTVQQLLDGLSTKEEKEVPDSTNK